MPLYSGYDIIAQSQSGTGKTGSFLIGAIQKVKEELKESQVLILSPTRELAQQIFDVLNAFTVNMPNLTKHILIGGKNISNDFQELDKRPQIIVGTPGRVYDMLKRFVLKPDHINLFILDEADEMLSRGFKDQIYEIFQYISKASQVALFSATMPIEALDITKKFMNDPFTILVKKEELTLEGIRQFYIELENDSYKFDCLCDIYSCISVAQTIIYCNSRRKADWIREKLLAKGFTVECIHGDMRQNERDIILNNFRNGKHRILLATDIISRGIDVQQVSLVINYDMPKYKETYIHRIGRSGRFGRKGTSINFITYEDRQSMRVLQSFYHTQIDPLPEDYSLLIA
jgi:translation initiation factor 4A